MSHLFKLPIALFPTAAQERLTDGQVADSFGLDVREVRAFNSFARDLLASRAIEGGYVHKDWSSKQRTFSGFLDEISHATMGHWSKLLTPVEREERQHVLFILRVMRKQHAQHQERRYHV